MKYDGTVTTAAVAENSGSTKARESRLRKLLAEVRQMSRVSEQQEGLLNHAQAAAILEVSTRRVGELVKLGKLTRWDFLGRTYVSVREVLDRREADVKAGRPLRSMAQRIRAAGRILGNYDAVNLAVEAITPEPKKRARGER